MKITEIASLVTKGFSVSDIKELAEMSATTPEVLEMAKTGAKVSDIKDLIALADSGKDEPGTIPPDPEQEKDPSTPDLKTQIENLQKENSELKATVSKIQKENARMDHSGDNKPIDPMDTLADIFKDVT